MSEHARLGYLVALAAAIAGGACNESPLEPIPNTHSVCSPVLLWIDTVPSLNSTGSPVLL